MIAVATATLSSHFIAFIGSLLSAHTGGLVLHLRTGLELFTRAKFAIHRPVTRMIPEFA